MDELLICIDNLSYGATVSTSDCSVVGCPVVCFFRTSFTLGSWLYSVRVTIIRSVEILASLATGITRHGGTLDVSHQQEKLNVGDSYH